MPLEEVIGEIIPDRFQPFKPLHDIISRVATHSKMLLQNDRGDSRPFIPPTIRNNNTLYLVE